MCPSHRIPPWLHARPCSQAARRTRACRSGFCCPQNRTLPKSCHCACGRPFVGDTRILRSFSARSDRTLLLCDRGARQQARQLAARTVRQHVLGSVARWQHAAGRRRRRKQRDIDRDRPQATGHKPQATDHVTCRHSDNADKGTTERPRRLI